MIAMDRKYWIAGLVAAAAAISAMVTAYVVTHRPAETHAPSIIYQQDTSPAANDAARTALIEKIKASHDEQWLKFGCLQYSQENDQMRSFAMMRGIQFTPPPSCRTLNALAPADATTR